MSDIAEDIRNMVRICSHVSINEPQCDCEKFINKQLVAAQAEIQRLKDQGKVNCELFDEVKRQRKEIATLLSRLRKLREALQFLVKKDVPANQWIKHISDSLTLAEATLNADTDEKE